MAISKDTARIKKKKNGELQDTVTGRPAKQIGSVVIVEQRRKPYERKPKKSNRGRKEKPVEEKRRMWPTYFSVNEVNVILERTQTKNLTEALLHLCDNHKPKIKVR